MAVQRKVLGSPAPLNDDQDNPVTPDNPSPEEVIKSYLAILSEKEKKKLLDEVMDQPKPEVPEDFTDAELRQMARLHMGKILSSGQSYTIGSRKLNRVDFDKLADYLAATAGKDDGTDDSNLFGSTWVAEFIPR